MNRRMLLRAALGLSAGAVTAPLWAPAVLASGTPSEQRAALSKAWRQAASDGKALVVMLIPADDGEKWTRGRALGEWLNNATDADLAPLSAAHVVFAGGADLRTLLPKTPVTDADWFVVVRPEPLSAKVLRVKLPPADEDVEWGDPEYGTEAHEKKNLARIAANGEAIQGVLYPVIASLGPKATGTGAAVRAALVKLAPPGAHWATSWGCGTDIEGLEEPYGVECGMGHVPKGSRRFLYLHDVSHFQGF